MFSDIASLVKTGVGVAVIVGAYFWHSDAVSDHDKALLADIKMQRDRDAIRAVDIQIELKTRFEGNANVEATELARLRDLNARLADANRVLDDDAKTFGARVQAATEAQLRAYAQEADRNLSGSRKDVERFGREATECSAKAWRIKSDVEAIYDAHQTWSNYHSTLTGALK